MARFLIKVFIYTILSLSFASHARGQSAKLYADDEIIVKMRPSSKSDDEYRFLGKAQMQKGLALKAQWRGMGLFHFQKQKNKSMDETLEELRQDPQVEYAEPNYIFSKASINDDMQSFTAGEVSAMSNEAQGSYLATGAPIQASDAWPLLTGTEKPIIAIIDTGLDISHSAFVQSGAVWTNSGEIPGNGIDDDGNGYIDDVNGWNFVSNSATMIDDDGHGTHVAGVVLGTTQDIYTPPFDPAEIQIMPLKFLDSNGVGKTSDAIEAIYYAIANGATVLNNSWGGPSYSAALHEAIAYSYEQGVTFVAAAGNNGSNNDSNPMFPASYNVPNILSIAATTDFDGLAYFSNFGSSTVDMGSPGYDILSTYPNGLYVSMRGTSMAAPFVAGVAAMMVHEKPGMMGYQVKSLLEGSGDFTTSLNGKTVSDNRLNVLNSVLNAKAATVDGSQPEYVFSNQDRDLASTIASSGCGMVSKLYSDVKNGKGPKGGSGSGGPETWYMLLILGLFAIPVLVVKALKSRTPESRRRHQRYKIDTEVKMLVDGKELIGSVSSIGLGGVQLNTNALLEQGGVVKMSIQSPDGKGSIEVEGCVVWSEQKKAYGVQFQEAKETVLERISGWTKGLAKT